MLEQVNYEDFTTAGEQKADEQLLVRFFLKEREDKAKSLAEGRPIFKETEYVEIRVAGRRDPLACRPATHQDKQRFPRHYDAFQKRIELPEEGTPLSEWPQISRSQVEELSFMHVKTVEQLAEMSDTHVGQFRGGYTLKKRAQDFLAVSDQTKLIAEKEALQDRISELEGQVKQLLELQQANAGSPTEPVVTETALDEETAPEPDSATPRKRRPRRKPAEE